MNTGQPKLIFGALGAAVLVGVAALAINSAGAYHQQRDELRTVYAIYNHPGCLSTGALEDEVGYITRETGISGEAAREKIAGFIQAGVPNLYWVRFTQHPDELAAWHGAKALGCDHNPNA